MGAAPPPMPNEGTLIKEVEGGVFEEIAYEIPVREEDLVEELAEESEDVLGQELGEAEEVPETGLGATAEAPEVLLRGLAEKPPNYIEAVARSQREAEALQQLARDFERAQKEQNEAEERAAVEAEEAMVGEVLESEEALSWPAEFEDGPIYEGPPPDYGPRFHQYTRDGSFHGPSVEVSLPKEEFVYPIADLLRRTHIHHVREAAERNYGGAGLPLSAETITGKRSGNMGPVGLLATQRHMTEIEGDAFMAGFMPAAYASSFAILREVRRRMGSDWIQSKLKNGGQGLSVLDVGSGGAGLVAWEQILNAEWDLLKENGEAEGRVPPGQKTAVAASDRLRNRLKTFLENTTFLPRMPDYEHSGEMRGPRLDGGDKALPRKSYDVIIASHQFLKESESHRRQAVLNNLWHLLKKDGGVLIIQEKAHPRGFEAVAHARHTILNSFLLPQSGEPRVAPEDFNATYHREPEPGHVVAPCTNQTTCPMYVETGKSTGRKDYCHFSQRFVRPNFYTKMLRKHADNHGEVEFSYVAVQRGVAKPARPTGKEATERAQEGYENSDTKPDMQTLPRLVLPALKRKGHVTMDVCTPEGKIERWTVPKSFSKMAYHDARKSRWGDLWALGAKSRVERSVRLGQTKEMSKRAEGSRKKAHKSALAEEEGEADNREVRKRKQPRSRKQKKLDMVAEMRRAEEKEIDELADEIEAEVEEEIEEEEKRRRQ
ncbi:37S ribosomal protein-like protein [Hapsidospora chrysogenum ATCC 11550]|uniref:37S ribosomal protein-like protein n=1 Tax=Hapsidospora chrysogenum (strain ATCC 11550 / CBS 779.69 / DSM 880 / IAM 14645 / JCM 23072 / IMI 49137) TaxID=857340 RepID=A0A086T0K3_HAPC1|nr:37S ribosomal protein-like protein [Hapsidospora chrysogenum ATCC 11550]